MKPIAQGYVTKVARTTFWCRLIIGKEEVEAQIEKSKLSDKEQEYLKEGAYISILKGGTIKFYKKVVTKKRNRTSKGTGTGINKFDFWKMI